MSRDILAPPLIRMGPNRIYRVNVVHADFGGPHFYLQRNLELDRQAEQRRRAEDQQNAGQVNGYQENGLYDEDDDDDDPEDCKLEEMPNGSWRLTMHVAQPFYGGLIGAKGATKHRIESETNTEIIIPRNVIGGKKSEDVVIRGESRSNLCAAYRQIKLVMHSLRRRMRVTHFVGVALNQGEIRKNFLEFKKRILEANYPGIEELLFVPDARLHITLTVCILLDDTERKRAIELLQDTRDFIEDLNTPFSIRVKGLEIMNDDASSVRVIYGIVDAPDLQKYADRCLESFKLNDLSNDEFGRNTVKLHMTVLNVKYLKKENPNAPNSFDARQIMKNFGDFDFGTETCGEIELCIRGTYVEDGAARGFYKRSSVFKVLQV